MIREYIDKWIRTQSNAELVIWAAVNDLGIKINHSSLVKDLDNYPFPYTLLQIRDILQNYQVDSVSVKTPWEKIESVGGGFLCQIKLDGIDYFTYVYQSDESHVTWLNPNTKRKETTAPSKFKDLFTGYVLMINPDDKSGESNYRRAHANEVRQNILFEAVLLALPVLFVSSLLLNIADGGLAWGQCLFALLLLAGCIVGEILMLHEYDAYTPIVTSVCGKSQKFNCSAVLESSGSRFLNIPWTVWGCSYFLGMLLAIMSSGYSEDVYVTVAFLHLLALPYVIYSIWYQKFGVRQWCPLCLTVQADIVALSLVALLSGCYSQIENLSISALPTIGINLVISFAAMWLLWLNFQQKKLKQLYKDRFHEVKYSSAVFHSLLEREPEAKVSTDGYGIILGNPNGSTHIIKVCNPYCGHCAAAQKVLDKLLAANHDIRLQIIFIMEPDDDGYDQTPVDIFLSLLHEGADMKSALDDWYSMPDKNLKVYSQRHPVKHHRTQENDENARRMAKFCETMKVTATPTFFVNGHKLPDLYNVGDLKYLV